MSIDLARYVRDVADFPKPGVVFKDLTPLLADAGAFAASIEALVAPFLDAKVANQQVLVHHFPPRQDAPAEIAAPRP